MMNRRTPLHWLACVALSLLAGGVAQSRSPGCEGAQFSAEVLSRFPRASEACLDIISRAGQDYAVFKAQLDRVHGNTLRLRFKYPDDTQSAPLDIKTQPEFRVLIDGKATRARDLAPGQELTAYVRVDQPFVALVPASESEALQFVPLPASNPALVSSEAPVMPQTASPVAAMGWLGQLCLAAALSLTLLRWRRS